MPGTVVTRKTGPRSFECAAPVTGGKLCEARAQGRVGHASAGSLKVLGVAASDGDTPESFNQGTVDLGGVPTLNANPTPNRVALIYGGAELEMTYTAPAAFGDKLKAAENGDVTPMVEGDDPRAFVGTCTQALGVPAGARGLMRTV